MKRIETENSPKISQIWTKLNPKLFWIPNFFDTESDIFSITNFFDTESETIHKNEKFWNREFSKSKRHILMKSESLSLLHSAFLVFFNCCQCLRPSFIKLFFFFQLMYENQCFFLFLSIYFFEQFTFLSTFLSKVTFLSTFLSRYNFFEHFFEQFGVF